jgi:hypothetical protein
VTFVPAGEPFAALFDTYERTAVRLEIRDRYAGSPVETEAARKFHAGEPDDRAWHRPWLDAVRRRKAEGKSMQRVRVVTLPLSEYAAFSFHNVLNNIAAGEDIQYLDRTGAAGLPGYDYWVFDDVRLYILQFDAADILLGAELVEDPDIVRAHRKHFDDAWSRSVPRAEFQVDR